MPEILKRNKALSISPLKASSTLGAALAFLGFARALPMLHGSQGCTAFGKVYFVRHFREPIPLQTTAMDQVSTVMGAQENIKEGLRAICSKSRPALIGLPTTGLAETQGADVEMALREFRKEHPEFAEVLIVPVATPDYSGCVESGFAAAVAAILERVLPRGGVPRSGGESKRVNVLVGAHLTPGDVEELGYLIELFGLEPVLLPNLGDSLDGHLVESDFSPLTIGGTPVADLARLSEACATLVVGASMNKAADLLAERTAIPDYRFDHLMGLDATDALIDTLHRISGQPVPARIERQRAQLQDTLLDTHFMLGMTPFALAGDPDLVNAFSHLLAEIGGEARVVVTTVNSPVLQRVAAEQVKIGDLGDLEALASDHPVALLIGNSHASESARRLGIPILHAGFPLWEQIGGYQRCWIGYRGSRQTLFDLANLALEAELGHIPPYRSIYHRETLKMRSPHAATATS